MVAPRQGSVQAPTFPSSGQAEKVMKVHKSDQSLAYVSYDDATAFANWYNGKTNQDFRMPTLGELIEAKRTLGNNFIRRVFEWTHIADRNVARIHPLLFDEYAGRYTDYFNPVLRYDFSAFRLVANK